jgi:hypothetical protein
LVALAGGAWIFGSVLQDVLAQEELALFDVPVVSYIASHRVDWLSSSVKEKCSSEFFQLRNQCLPNLFRFRRERFNGLGDVQAETEGLDQE